jgi:hypothetical protein
MNTFLRLLCFVIATMIVEACSLTKSDPQTRAGVSALGAASVPPLTQTANEVEISPDLTYEDPTWVLGAIVNRQTGEVYGLSSFLKKTAKPAVSQINDVVFDDLLSQSIDLNGSYLAFLKADISSSSTDEVSVVKTSKAVLTSADVDTAAVLSFLRSVPLEQRPQFALIAGYVDVTITASYLMDSGLTATASGFGAAMGGKWYAKSKNLRVQHTLIALVTTTAIATQTSESTLNPDNVSLVKLTEDAITNGGVDPEALRVTHPLINGPKP